MPRISETIALAGAKTTTYKATRPQNGDSPASFREVNATKALADLEMINLGVSQTSSGQRTYYRTKASMVSPRHDSEGQLLPSDRFDLTGRLSSELTEADITALQEKLSLFILSPEFKAALAGDAQF